jgi:hypothetical protein
MRNQGILVPISAMIAAMLALSAGGVAHAQGAPVYVGPGGPPPYEPPGYVRAEPLPDDALLPREVVGILRSTGFSPLSPPFRRGRFYFVAVIDPNGEDGQVTFDAISGRLVRFVPSDVIGRSMASYPPPPYAPPRRSGPRPPMPLPGVASRDGRTSAPLPAARPPAAPQPNTQTASAGTTSAGPANASAKSAEPIEVKPSFGKPAGGPALLPLQSMPPAQGFD